MKRGFLSMLAALLLVMAAAGPLRADEVKDQIQAGLKAYEEGNYDLAIEELNFAVQQIMQKQGDSLAKLFPEPLKGWSAEKADSSAAGQGFLGGGINANREYRKGDAQIKISYLSNSPMISSLAMIMSNPMFAGSQGGKMERINGEKALVKFEEENQSGDLNIVLRNKMLVQLEGNGITRQDLVDYAKQIDFKALKERIGD